LRLENVTFVPTEICDKEGSLASRVRCRLFLYIFFLSPYIFGTEN
jgi:hypothetical protein